MSHFIMYLDQWCMNLESVCAHMKFVCTWECWTMPLFGEDRQTTLLDKAASWYLLLTVTLHNIHFVQWGLYHLQSLQNHFWTNFIFPLTRDCRLVSLYNLYAGHHRAKKTKCDCPSRYISLYLYNRGLKYGAFICLHNFSRYLMCDSGINYSKSHHCPKMYYTG